MISKEKIISFFILSILIIIGFNFIDNSNDFKEEQLNKYSITILESQASSLEKSILQSTNSAKILGTHIKTQNGKTDTFNTFSKELIDSISGISNLQIIPNGIVTNIYPLKGNEEAIGHDIINSNDRKKESSMAINSKKITLAGPFDLRQGGVGIIARYPLFIDNNFWGFTSTMIEINKLLETTNLYKLKDKKYLYRIKRVHPDTKKIHIFAGTKVFPEGKIFSKEINVPNNKWIIDIIYTGSYISNPIRYTLYLLAIIISLLLSYLFYLLLNKPKEIKEQKKLLEQKIKEQTLEIQNNLETISNRVIYFRINLEGILTDVSDIFCKTSGYDKSELLNNGEQLNKEIWTCLKNKGLWKGELKKIKKNGSYYWISTEISTEYNIKKEKIGYLSIMQNITAQKELEKQQLYIIEQDKRASLGQLIGNIAHQWRQPLNVISVSASGIKLHNEMNTLNKTTLEELTNAILKQTQFLTNTIETFRSYIDTKDTHQQTNKIDINDTLNMIEGTLNAFKIKVRKIIKNDNKIKNIMIPSLLSQVIINIITNSKDALIQNNIQNPWIEIILNTKKDKYLITIEDNAKGIDPKILPHIFEPYFTTKHKAQGIGLGLYLSHKIITENLDGEIYVQNSKNGAKFFIKVPNDFQ